MLPLFLFPACGDQEGGDAAIPYIPHPILVVCEGNFGSNNASLAVLDTALTNDTTYLDVFRRVNGRRLGDLAHAVCIVDSTAYIAVTHSHRVEIVDAYSYASKGYLSITSPRGFAQSGGFLYITSYDDSALVVIRLADQAVVSEIPLTHKPDAVVIAEGKAFVTSAPNLGDSVISEVDLGTYSTDTIVVGRNPVAAAVDAGGKVYVACSGISSSDGYIAAIDASTGVVVGRIGQFTSIRPVKVAVQDSLLACITSSNGGIGIYNVNTSSRLATLSGNFNGLRFIGGELYTLDATDYLSGGILRRYRTDYTLFKEYPAGPVPSDLAVAR
jgi:DNA-binding beta-propeller fold protein YncE